MHYSLSLADADKGTLSGFGAINNTHLCPHEVNYDCENNKEGKQQQFRTLRRKLDDKLQEEGSLTLKRRSYFIATLPAYALLPSLAENYTVLFSRIPTATWKFSLQFPFWEHGNSTHVIV